MKVKGISSRKLEKAESKENSFAPSAEEEPTQEELEENYMDLITKDLLAQHSLNLSSQNLSYISKQIKLGPKRKSKTLILDLDETLIGFKYGSSGIEIKLRPHARKVLKKLKAYFDIMLFTASTKEFANPIVDLVDPDNAIFRKRFFRDSCVLCSRSGVGGVGGGSSVSWFVKDLRIFSDRRFAEMIIVDNSVLSFAFQINNGVPIIPYIGQRNDEEMLTLFKFLVSLKDSDDVRDQIKKAFKLEERFNQLAP